MCRKKSRLPQRILFAEAIVQIQHAKNSGARKQAEPITEKDRACGIEKYRRLVYSPHCVDINEDKLKMGGNECYGQSLIKREKRSYRNQKCIIKEAGSDSSKR